MPTVWRDRIRRSFPEAALLDPASQQMVDDLAVTLGNEIPDDLRELLLEANGVTHAEYGYFILWPTERIASDNLAARTGTGFASYMALSNLLFFADAGNGDMFGYGIDSTGQVRRDIYSWDHEDDSRNWAAPDLATFIAWLADGKILT